MLSHHVYHLPYLTASPPRVFVAVSCQRAGRERRLMFLLQLCIKHSRFQVPGHCLCSQLSLLPIHIPCFCGCRHSLHRNPLPALWTGLCSSCRTPNCTGCLHQTSPSPRTGLSEGNVTEQATLPEARTPQLAPGSSRSQPRALGALCPPSANPTG